MAWRLSDDLLFASSGSWGGFMSEGDQIAGAVKMGAAILVVPRLQHLGTVGHLKKIDYPHLLVRRCQLMAPRGNFLLHHLFGAPRLRRTRATARRMGTLCGVHTGRMSPQTGLLVSKKL